MLKNFKRYVNSYIECKKKNVPVKAGTFQEWFRLKGKQGGQFKIPRLSNERKVLDEVLKLN